MEIFIRIVVAISRYLLPTIAVIILVKCVLALVLGHPKEKIYGYIIDVSDGKSYPLNIWETSVGRSNSCDISVNYNSVSRFQAVISRRVDGWYIYDLLSKAGTSVNGVKVDKKATISNGDILSFGIIQYRFVVADDPVISVGKKRGRKKGNKPEVEIRPRRDINRPEINYDELYLYDSDGNYIGSPVAPGKTGYTQPEAPEPYEPSQTGKDVTGEATEKNLRSIFAGYMTGMTGKAYSDKTYEVETPSEKAVAEQTELAVSGAVLTDRDTGKSYALSGEFIKVGRGRTNDIILNSPAVSRRHANIVLYDDGWAIEDAGSSAGTYLNDERVESPMLLFDGDVIGLADERLYYTVRQTSYK